MAKTLEVSYTDRPVLSPEEIAANQLTEAEFEAIIAQEQAEADAWAAEHGR